MGARQAESNQLKIACDFFLSLLCSFSSFSIVIDGERGNRPKIYSLEQLLQEAVSLPRCTKTLFGTRKAITCLVLVTQHFHSS